MDKRKLSSKKPKVLILGSSGQVGKTLKKKKIKNFKIEFIKQKKFSDINNYGQIEKIISKINPRVIINAAAFTNVDLSEKNKQISKKTNFLAVKNLAKICKKNNIFFIHFSSDYVYGDNGYKKLSEEFKKKPVNYYGITKLNSEISVKESSCNHVILRTAWIYSHYKNNFFSKVKKKLKNNENLSIVSDQIGTPTSTLFIHYIIEKILNKVQKNDFKLRETFNAVPSGYVSWFQFAKLIKKKFQYNNVKVKKLLSGEYISLADRQLNSRLNNKKLQKFLNIKIKDWKFYFNRTIKLLNET